VRSCQAMSDEAYKGIVKSCKVRSGQVTSDQIMSDRDYIRTGEVRTRSCQLNTWSGLGQVMSVQYKIRSG